MNYYLLKVTVNTDEGKQKKENYAVKAESSIIAEATGTKNLSHKDIVEITDINKKNWTEVVANADGGDWFEVKSEWDDIDGKTIKDVFLVQEHNTKDAEDVVSNIDVCEITGTNKTNILNYFIQKD